MYSGFQLKDWFCKGVRGQTIPAFHFFVIKPNKFILFGCPKVL